VLDIPEKRLYIQMTNTFWRIVMVEKITYFFCFIYGGFSFISALFPRLILRKYFNVDERDKVFDLGKGIVSLGVFVWFFIPFFIITLINIDIGKKWIFSFHLSTWFALIILLILTLIYFIPAILKAKNKKAEFLFLLKFASTGIPFLIKIFMDDLDYTDFPDFDI
jgi:hypothetical protein